MSLSRRAFTRTAALTLASTALPLHAPAISRAQTPVASPDPIDPMALVHPEFRPALEAMLETMPAEMTFSADVLPGLREAQAQFMLPQLPEPPVSEEIIPGPADAPELKVFVINAEPGANRPVVLHIHGGGHVIGSAESSVPMLQAQARDLDCVIVTVEYRLAPETPFPGSLEDNYAALTWLYGNATELGADPELIALQGESSGGGQVATLAIAARDRGEVPVIFQALIYPMLDDRTGSSHELPAHIGAFVWTPQANQFGWTSLLGVPAGSDDVPVAAVPARVEDLSGLPPTWIGVGAIDLFVYEDIEFANRLILAGVPTELVVVPGGYHGFDTFAPESRLSQQFTLSYFNALASAFGQPPVAELGERPSMMGQ